MSMSNLTLAEYQASFTAHIRDPKNAPKPKGVNNARMGVYREIVFNNIFGSVSACYPVLQNILGKRKWQQLCRGFFSQHHNYSPLFRDIPKAFLDYLALTELAPALKQLAHYEWAELALSHFPAIELISKADIDLLDDKLALTPAHLLLNYNYPVHTLSKSNPPKTSEPTFILMHRNADYQIQFIVLNALTYQLLLLIQEGLSGRQALTKIAKEIQHPEPESMIQFGKSVLTELQGQHLFFKSTK